MVTHHSPSHGDLDPKNALVVCDGVMAVDWDAAAVYSTAREAVSLALDWSTDVAGFRRVLGAYTGEGKAEIVDEPWVFGGWVAAQVGWLVYNATVTTASELGRKQVLSSCNRLLWLQRSIAEYQAALR